MDFEIVWFEVFGIGEDDVRFVEFECWWVVEVVVCEVCIIFFMLVWFGVGGGVNGEFEVEVVWLSVDEVFVRGGVVVVFMICVEIIVNFGYIVV